MGAIAKVNVFDEVLGTSLARTFARSRRGDLVWKAERAYALEILRKNDYMRNKCDPHSLSMAMLDAAWSGLSLNPTLGMAYLIPYEEMITFKPSYRGLEQLVYRAGTVTMIQTALVKQGDYFRLQTINNRRVIEHTEKHGAKAEVIAAYCIVHYASTPIPYVETMTREELDVVEQIALDQGNNGKGGKVWRTALRGEMQRKTVLRRALKHAPLDAGGHIEHAQAVANKFDGVDFDKMPESRDDVEALVSRDQVNSAHKMLTDAGMPSASADRWLQLVADSFHAEDFAKLPEKHYSAALAKMRERLEQRKKGAA